MITFLLTLALHQVPVTPEVFYEISFPNAVHHEANVAVTYRGLPARPLELRMSRSSPGAGGLFEFAQNVYDVEAVDGAGAPLHVTRPNEHQWNVNRHTGHVRVTYTLYGDLAGGGYSGIDRTHAHLDMPATFMFARNTLDWPVRIRFVIPAGSTWRIATQLAPTMDPHVFTAPNVQYFFDSPVELSNHALRKWMVARRDRVDTLRIAIHHLGTNSEVDAFAAKVKRIVLEQEAVFGELPRFDYGTYTFIADVLPWMFAGANEHRNSTTITNTGSLARNEIVLLGSAAHEFFHAWNVERIRPHSLEPFDFERANTSEELWFAEGFTSYYSRITLKRAGLISLDEFAQRILRSVSAVLTLPSRSYFSPVEVSMQAPFINTATPSMAPNNRANTSTSYYISGAAIALALDLMLRTEKATSLDSFMQAMWSRYGRSERPYGLEDWRLTLGYHVRDQTWANVFFSKYVIGRDAADFGSLLKRAGLLLRKAAPGQATLGSVSLARDTTGVVLASNTLLGSPLYEAGVDRGDWLVSLDGNAINSPADLDAMLRLRKPGQRVNLVYKSRGESRDVTVNLVESEQLELLTYEAAGMAVTKAMEQLREQWLGSKTTHER